MITNRIKRGTNATLPNGAAGEPLFTTDTYDLYIGKGDGTNQRFQKYMSDAITGTGVANQVTYFSGANTIAGSTFLTLDLTADYGYLKLTGGATYKNADIWLNRYSNAWENAIRFQTNGTTDWYVGSGASGTNSDFEIYNYGTTSNGIKIAKATNNVTIGGTITGTIDALATAAAIFVTSDGGTLKSRTAAEVLGDIGAQATSEKGQNNGYASLDAGGKIPASQLPSSVMEYKGTWDASTNTPTLANGTGDNGDVYLCNVAGSVNFGAGAISFEVGDWAVYNGTIWQKSINSNAVVSVNGQTGVVSLALGNLSNVTESSVVNAQLLRYNSTSTKWENWTPTFEPGITAGTTAQYWRGDKSWQDFNTAARSAISLTTTNNAQLATYTSGVLNIPRNLYLIPTTGNSVQWVNVGRFTASQTGRHIKISIIGHTGYNASQSQSAEAYIIFKTADSGSVDGNGFAGDSYYYRTGLSTSFASSVKWVANAAGTGASYFDLYVNFGVYTYGSFYTVEKSDDCTWSNIGTTGHSDPGVGSNTVCVSTEQLYVISGINSVGTLKASIPAFGSASTKFLIDNGGSIESRTAAQTLSDIGGVGKSSPTANTITYWVDTNTVGSLATSTYPSLTELSYVKGVTSAIQTQLNGKQPLLSSPLAFGGTITATGYTGTNYDNLITPSYYRVNGGSDTRTTLVMDAAGSVGAVQMEFNYSGAIRWRNKTDSTTWTGWRSVWTSADVANPVTGTGTANWIGYWVDANTIGALTTATYPSLTELSYVKGVTSAIQTQINSKEPTITAGTTAEYWRGDKTWQNFNTAARGAISLTTTNDSNGASYSSGVINIPQKVYTLPNTGNTAQWVRVGRFTAGQSGYVCKICIYGHESYNATITQNAEVEIFFKTSNGGSVDSDGFAGDSYYYEKGIASGFVQGVKWVSNANGVAASYFDLYVYFGQYNNGSFYTVNISDSTSWSNTGATGQTDPGAASASVMIPTQKYYIISDIESLGAIKASFAAFGSAASTFLISDSGTIKSRTAAQVLSDIGAVGKSSPTTNTITYWVDANTIGSLATSSYPSLTELSYVKGVTSAIQTQIDGKLSLSGGTLTGALSGTSATFNGNVSVGAEVFRGVDNSYLRIAGGNPAATGGIAVFYGSTHATKPNVIELTADGAGYIAMSTNSVTRLTIASTGAATFSSSVTANNFTGAYFDYKPGGTETFFIGKSSYNVFDGNQLGLATFTSIPIEFATANTRRMIITSGGLVQINHTNTAKGNLDVASDVNAVPLVIRGRSADGEGQVEFWNYAGSTRYGVLGSTSNYSYFGSIANTPLFFQTNSTERMRITSGGELYVDANGTSGADLKDGAFLYRNNSGSYLQMSSGTNSNSTLFYFYRKNAANNGVDAVGNISYAGTSLVLNGGGNSNQLVLKNSGNVSINNTNDTYKLDVTGTTFSTGLISRWYTPTGNFNYATAGSAGWVLIGTINLPQQGYDCTLTMQGGVGYNGDLDQNGYAVLKIRTSNGTGYSAHYERYGRNGNFVSTIKIKSTGSDNYEIYAYTSNYVGLGYTNFIGSLGSSFTPSGTSASDPGTGASITTVTSEIRFISSITSASSITATSFFESSDIRLKSNIQDYKSNDILNISAKIYEKDGKIEVGYLAQDLQSVLKSAVSVRDNGYLDLSYRQVHTAKIAALEAKIKELEAKLK